MKHRLVQVTWVDTRCQGGWEEAKEALRFETCEVVSIGWLISEYDKRIVIAGDFNEFDDQYARIQAIPRGCIKKIKRIKDTP